MKKSTIRLGSVLLACVLLIHFLPVYTLAATERPVQAPAQTQEIIEPAPQASLTPVPVPGTVVAIDSADDLAAAIAGQEDGQVWSIAEGVYELTQAHLDQYAHWDAPGQGGWYFPLYADHLTILGEGQVVITSAVESENGAWASQDFISVWGDGITIDGVDVQSKSVPNKAIEIMGKDFTLRNSTILPVVHPDGEQGEVFSGSIYFNPLNAEGDLGDSTLEHVYLHSYISASAAKAGTLNVRDITMDATKNIWSVWGTGYGPGLVGDVYGEIEDVRYLVDESAILSDILDSTSPYAADTKPGTTIVFSPGVYELRDPLTIGKDVALVGAGRESTTFLAGAEPTVLLQVDGGDVDFSMSGIYIKGVDDNRHNNSSAVQIGTNGNPSTGQIVIEGCRFSDFTKNSITVKGGNASITGNIIDCKPYPGAAGNGIQIDMGAKAVITGNRINGYTSQAENWSACGVLVLRDGKITSIRDNTITACGIGITKETYYDTEGDNTYLDRGAAKNNTFQDCIQDVEFEFDLAAEIEAYSGGVILLPCDVVLDEPLLFDKDIAIDGNGFTIYGCEKDPAVGLEVVGGTFQLSNVTLDGFGGAAEAQPDHAVFQVPSDAAPDTRVVLSDVHVKHFNHCAYRICAGSFSITGGTIDCAQGGSGDGSLTRGIWIGGTAEPVTGILSRITITGFQADDTNWQTTAIEIANNTDVEVSGCVVRQVRSGIYVSNEWYGTPGPINVAISATELDAADDAILVSSRADAASQATVHIQSGTYIGQVRMADRTGSDVISVTGGNFSLDPSEYVAPGYCVSNDGGMYWVHLPFPEEDLPGDDTPEDTPDSAPDDTPDNPPNSTPDDRPDSTPDNKPDHSTPPAQPQPSEPETSDGHTTVSTEVTPTVSGSTSRAEIPSEVMDQAVESVLEAAAQSDTAPVIEIVVDSGTSQCVEVVLPVPALDRLGGHENARFTVTSGVATVTLDSVAITAVASQSDGAQITLVASPVAAEDLNEKQQAVAGGAPVFDLHLKSGDTAIPHFGGGSATVSIPHLLSEGQDADGVAVYHLDDLGNTTLRGTSYDTDSGKVTFSTPHFSKYMIGYTGSRPGENPFTDVTETDYFYQAVLWAVEHGVTHGTSDDTFSPDGICTRAQAVLFLWRAAGSPKPERTDSPFADVGADDLYYDAVVWAAEEGITFGTSSDTFSPDDPCSRAQIVTLLWRLDGQPASAPVPGFTDVARDAYYYDAVAWAAEKGVTLGTPAGTFLPDVMCTRAQIVTFLFRYAGG